MFTTLADGWVEVGLSEGKVIVYVTLTQTKNTRIDISSGGLSSSFHRFPQFNTPLWSVLQVLVSMMASGTASTWMCWRITPCWRWTETRPPRSEQPSRFRSRLEEPITLEVMLVKLTHHQAGNVWSTAVAFHWRPGWAQYVIISAQLSPEQAFIHL